MADTVGMADLRAENVERIVKGFALQKYVMKQICMIQSSSSWKETYFQETAADLTGHDVVSIVEGIPRLAQFPAGEVSWTEKNAWMKKHGMDAEISWEDAKTNSVDVIARTLLRIARAVVKSVDTDIWDVLTENQTPVLINSVAITAGDEWDSATIANRDPIQDILNAKKEISVDNYDIEGGVLMLSPKDYANLLGNANIRNAGQFYTDSVTRNGNVGQMLGLTVRVSNSVTADKAGVFVPKECGTYKQAAALKIKTMEDFGIKYTIRAWEVGITQLTNPEAVCLITNTQA